MTLTSWRTSRSNRYLSLAKAKALQVADVALLSGSAFGGYVRLSYANSVENPKRPSRPSTRQDSGAVTRSVNLRGAILAY